MIAKARMFGNRFNEDWDDVLALLLGEVDLLADPFRVRRRLGSENEQRVCRLDLRTNRRCQRRTNAKFALVEPSLDAPLGQLTHNPPGDELIAMRVAEKYSRRGRRGRHRLLRSQYNFC